MVGRDAHQEKPQTKVARRRSLTHRMARQVTHELVTEGKAAIARLSAGARLLAALAAAWGRLEATVQVVAAPVVGEPPVSRRSPASRTSWASASATG